MILGMNWLHSHSPITFDSTAGTLTVQLKGNTIILHLKTLTASLHLCEHISDPTKEVIQGNSVFLAHILCAETSSSQDLSLLPVPVQQLLDQYKDIFQTPSSLPTSRSCDHKILLAPHSKSFTLRPYRFYNFQKLEIEKNLEELLSNDFIQPSSSSFASHVLLVKKKDNLWCMCVDYKKLNDITIKNRKLNNITGN
jgi:hypothetical protein